MFDNLERPSGVRILGCVATILSFFTGSYFYMMYIIELEYQQWPIITYIWGKFLVIFISGSLFLGWFAIIGAGMIIGLTILQGKQRFFPHLIAPFPEVFHKEYIKDFRMERADDDFFIFDISFMARKLLIVLGGCVTIASSYLIYKNLDNVYSQIYSPPGAGFMLVFLVMFLYGVLHPSRRFVLDRMKGTVRFPGHLFFPPCTIPFSKIVPGISTGRLGFSHPYTGILIPVLGQFESGWWTFYVLYMDKNRPLPQGTGFAPYREKDFLRRKAEGFPKPIYPNTSLVTDAYMGYIYGTDEFKARLPKLKHSIIHCYTRVSWYCQDENIKMPNPNDLVLIGIWKIYYVFKLFAPENVEYIVIPSDTELHDCFLCNGNTDEVTRIE